MFGRFVDPWKHENRSFPMANHDFAEIGLRAQEAQVGAKLGLRWPQVGLSWSILAEVGHNLAHLGPSWPEAGPGRFPWVGPGSPHLRSSREPVPFFVYTRVDPCIKCTKRVGLG